MNVAQAVASVILALHGLVHLIGFVVPWRLGTIEGLAYGTTLLNGALEVGDVGAKAVGTVWLLLAMGFIAAAFGVWRGESWALLLTAGLAAASLVVCVLGLPQAAVGIVVNFAILGVVVYVMMAGRTAINP